MKKVILTGIIVLVFLFSQLFLFDLINAANLGETCSTIGEHEDGFYCSLDGTWKEFKNEGSDCFNDYECVNGDCNSGKCQSKFDGITDRIQQTDFLEQIINFFKQTECSPGETKCEGTVKFECASNGVWVDMGNDVSCGYNPGDDDGDGDGDGDGNSCTPLWNCSDWSNPSEFCGEKSCNDLRCDSTPKTYRRACPAPEGRCGDGIIDTDKGEECDDGTKNSDIAKSACRTDCTYWTCGDGVCDRDEDPINCEEDCEANSEPGWDWLKIGIVLGIFFILLLIIIILIVKSGKKKEVVSSGMSASKDTSPPGNQPPVVSTKIEKKKEQEKEIKKDTKIPDIGKDEDLDEINSFLDDFDKKKKEKENKDKKLKEQKSQNMPSQKQIPQPAPRQNVPPQQTRQPLQQPVQRQGVPQQQPIQQQPPRQNVPPQPLHQQQIIQRQPVQKPKEKLEDKTGGFISSIKKRVPFVRRTIREPPRIIDNEPTVYKVNKSNVIGEEDNEHVRERIEATRYKLRGNSSSISSKDYKQKKSKKKKSSKKKTAKKKKTSNKTKTTRKKKSSGKHEVVEVVETKTVRTKKRPKPSKKKKKASKKKSSSRRKTKKKSKSKKKK